MYILPFLSHSAPAQKPGSTLPTGRCVSCFLAFLIGLSAFVFLDISVIQERSLLLRPTSLFLGRPRLSAGWTGALNASSTNFYLVDSVPDAVRTYVAKRVARAPDCESHPNALLVRCCRGWACGGTSDRIRGISGLLVAASAANRTLCFSRSWLFPGPEDPCRGGKTVWMRLSRENDDGVIRKSGGERRRLTIRSPDLLRDVKFVGSSHPAGIPEIGVPRKYFGPTAGERNYVGAKKLGFLALSYAGIINDVALEARVAVQSAVAMSVPNRVPGRPLDFVALHVRCGGSSFATSQGQRIVALDYHDGMASDIPDLLMKAILALPRDLVCQRPLFMASDSIRYIAEFKMAAPRRMPVVSCCSSPAHVDLPRFDSRSSQHFVDMAAFALARSIYATRGGYAELGAQSMQWNGPPINFFTGRQDPSNAKKWSYSNADATRFVDKLQMELDCKRRPDLPLT